MNPAMMYMPLDQDPNFWENVSDDKKYFHAGQPAFDYCPRLKLSGIHDRDIIFTSELDSAQEREVENQ